MSHRLVGISPGEADDHFFTGTTRSRSFGRLYGGQVAAQALTAADATVTSDRSVHSLHCYFIRMGEPGTPVDFHVERIRDGRGFSTRRVTASQDGRVILDLIASFHVPEPGREWNQHAAGPFELPPPGSGPKRLAHLADYLEFRSVVPVSGRVWQIHPFWFRASKALPEDPALHASLITYVSDLGILANGREPGRKEPLAVVASLDHSLWFHHQPNLNDWILFASEPVAHVGVRGMARGTFHDRQARLVASVTQEGLFRPARQAGARS